MNVVRGRLGLTAALGRRPHRAAVAIGNFDGVHRGHQALLSTARHAAGQAAGQAAEHGGEVIAFTFDPHPARLFAPSLSPPLIVSLQRRIELLGAAGADIVVVEPFTAEFAAMEAEAFVHEVLARDLGAAHVVIGYDFSFGKGRRGNTAMMESLAHQAGLEATVVKRVAVHGITCSSTRIREFVLEGQVEGAEVLLGRPYEMSGQVVAGAARGRALGYPTANLRLDTDLRPRPGIYAARARLLPARTPDATRSAGAPVGNEGLPEGVWTAALSVGTNPTFAGDGALTVEAHLLDFSGDLYGRFVRLEVLQRLRDERRFESVEALVEQIADDVGRTRAIVDAAAPPKGL
jgi:riboflavin kinase / FMN adenylyltransferase